MTCLDFAPVREWPMTTKMGIDYVIDNMALHCCIMTVFVKIFFAVSYVQYM